MPASEVTEWMAFLKMENDRQKDAHAKAQSNAAMSRQKQVPFRPKGNR